MNANDLIILIMDFMYLIHELIFGFLEFFWRMVKPVAPKNLAGEVAIVTGAGHGMGRELSLQLAHLGVSVICWDLNEKTCRETCRIIREKGQRSWAFKCDVSDRKEVVKVSEESRNVAPNRQITMIFNNAGIMPCKPFLEHSSEDIERTFKVNVFSQMYTILEFLPEFYENNRGHIVSMCSMAGVVGTPNLSVYCSSKFAVKGLMDTLFLEQGEFYPDSKVKMTTIHPYTINTGMAENPINRFNSLFPIYNADEAASMIIESVRRDEEYATIPRNLIALYAGGRMLPRRIQIALKNFLCVGVNANENPDYEKRTK